MTSIKELFIGEKAISIGNYAFRNCSGLTSVTIGNSVTSIGANAFSGCRGLNTVTIPNSITSIGNNAFDNCNGLNSVNISDLSAWCKISFSSAYSNPCSLAHHLFHNGQEITSINIPDEINLLNAYVFSGCSSLTSVTIPNGVTAIGASAFSGCSGLASVTIPNGVTSIGASAFYGCSSLTSVAIPNGVNTINNSVFSGCSGLTSITIPNSVSYIGESAFSGCSSLTSVAIPNGVNTINNSVFYGCSGLTSITIPNSVSDIGSSAFYGCSSLTSVTIPDNIVAIGAIAFYGCSRITSIIVGSGVGGIGSQAFYDCFNLESIKMLPTTPPNANDNTFSNYEKTLMVPESALTLYKNRTPWNKFTKIMTFSDGGEGDEACATPTISYKNGKITFNCETEGVEYTSNITDSDISNYTTSTIDLTVTYNISVYAHKSGYKDSETVTATLCWIDVEPKTEGITNSVSSVSAEALLIKCDRGLITVEGADDGEHIHVYNPAGSQEGTAISQNRLATINTHIKSGDIAIIKIGSRAVKVVMK